MKKGFALIALAALCAAPAVAQVNTVANSDSGLLGMALRDDHTAVVHYTTPNQTADVISAIDLDSEQALPGPESKIDSDEPGGRPDQSVEHVTAVKSLIHVQVRLRQRQ